MNKGNIFCTADKTIRTLMTKAVFEKGAFSGLVGLIDKPFNEENYVNEESVRIAVANDISSLAKKGDAINVVSIRTMQSFENDGREAIRTIWYFYTCNGMGSFNVDISADDLKTVLNYPDVE